MKACVLSVGVALILCTSVVAAPSVALDGNLYIYTTDNNTVAGYHYANISKLPWTAGVAGAANKGFFNTINHNADSLGFGYSNFDLYNHNLYVDVMDNTIGPRTPTVWKVDGATGAGTKVFVATNGDPGYMRSMAVDRSTGDIYFSSNPDKRANRLHDGNTDGDYNDAGEKTPLGMPGTLWGGNQYNDAEFFGGWMYFVAGDTRNPPYFISRLRPTPTDNNNIAVARTSWPGWPHGLGDPWVDGGDYLAVGDPDKDGKRDIYAHMGLTASTTIRYVLGHWEDANADGFFSAAEMIDNIALANNARDVELVTDGIHSMIVYIDSACTVRYVSLLDNGLIGGGTGTLFALGLTPSNNTFIHLKMDQAIPEPATMTLLAAGACMGLLARARRARAGRSQ